MRQTNDPLGTQCIKGIINCGTRNFGRITGPPECRVNVIGQVQSGKMFRHSDTTKSNQLTIILHSPPPETVLFPMPDIAQQPVSACLPILGCRIGAVRHHLRTAKQVANEFKIRQVWLPKQQASGSDYYAP